MFTPFGWIVVSDAGTRREEGPTHHIPTTSGIRPFLAVSQSDLIERQPNNSQAKDSVKVILRGSTESEPHFKEMNDSAQGTLNKVECQNDFSDGLDFLMTRINVYILGETRH